jgi:hypothetical protein
VDADSFLLIQQVGGICEQRPESIVYFRQKMCYIITVMKQFKSLLRTNKFLANKLTRQRILVVHAAASARIEGVPNSMRIAQSAAGVRYSRRTSKRP